MSQLRNSSPVLAPEDPPAAYQQRGAPEVFARSVVVLLLLITGLLLTEGSSATVGPAERVEALLDRIAAEQRQVQTLIAHFEQHQESALWLEPELSHGRFFYQAPDRMRWEFASPPHALVIVRGEEMLTWYRDEGRAERLKGGKQGRLWRFLSAPHLALESMRRHFLVHAIFPAAAADPYRLELEPRDAQVARRLAGMTLWIDPSSYLPATVSYRQAEGELTELRFTDVETDVELAAELFELTLPSDVELRSIGER